MTHDYETLWQRDKSELVDFVLEHQSYLVAAGALLEGMTTEAKRHAARASKLEAELARALAQRMFGQDPGVFDRVGALAYLRGADSRGGRARLPEATPDDLDAACEGLETPWGSGPTSERWDEIEADLEDEGF